MKEKFYITTPIYYTNAKPHIGHAYTTIACDVLARWNRLLGNKTFFLTGTDEHGAKIQKRAEEAGIDPQKFVDGYAEIFQDLWRKLNISNDGFIRTTSENHKKAVQKVLQTLFDNGSIYKGSYKGLYCVGCEQFKSENELVDGKCPDHGTMPEEMEEECYLMKMNKWQETLIEKIKNDEFKIEPIRYKKEILSFLEGQKLEDVSISRKNLSWGIPLPFDTEHTTYVWIDAFLNYLTGIGWAGDVENVPEFWPANVEMIGKDILRVHATIWTATLLNLGLELPERYIVHGHIQSGGKKMSKSLGNVIDPEEMLEKFGAEGTRYLLMSGGAFGDDLDLTMERMTEKYNSDLANGLGNLISRIIKLSQNIQNNDLYEANQSIDEIAEKEFAVFKKIEMFDQALEAVWEKIRNANIYIEDSKPWELAKNDEEDFKHVMRKLMAELYVISAMLTPFMPETSEKIKKALETKVVEPLFSKDKMMLFDTHAHVNFNAFKDDGEGVLRRCFNAGMKVVNVGSQYSTSKRATEYAHKFDGNLFAAVGIHPIHLKKGSFIHQDPEELIEEEIPTIGEKFDYERYLELAKDEKVVAIGEIGLDYHHFDESDNREEIIKKQKEVLIEFINLANEVQKPVMLHCWDAYDDLLEILEKHPVQKKGIVHSFIGSYKTAKKFIELGYKIGLNGIITYGNSYDRLLKEIDIENIVIETDCPYLTPRPLEREMRNEPLFVEYVAKKIAEVKGISFEEVAKKTMENGMKILSIK